MRFFTLLLLGILFLKPAAHSQTTSDTKIQWLTLEEATAKSKVEKRKILMFLYTDWCKWWKKMESATLSDEKIVAYINQNFYPVKFNAESKEKINFQDKVYSFQSLKPNGVHGFAVEVMNGRVSFPTITFFDENWELIQSIPNYQERDKFEKVITYFGGNFHKKIPWSTYEHYYTTTGGK